MNKVLFILGFLISNILIGGNDIKVFINNMELKSGDSHYFKFQKLELLDSKERVIESFKLSYKEDGKEVLDTLVKGNILFFHYDFKGTPNLVKERVLVISNIKYKNIEQSSKKIELKIFEVDYFQPSIKDIQAFNTIRQDVGVYYQNQKISSTLSLSKLKETSIITVTPLVMKEGQVLIVRGKRPVSRIKIENLKQIDFSSNIDYIKEGDYILIDGVIFEDGTAGFAYIFYIEK